MVPLVGFGIIYCHAETPCTRTQGVPGVYSHASFYIKHAQAGQPETISLTSSGPLVFTLDRRVKGQANVLIRRVGPDKKQGEIVCETGWVDPVVRPTFTTPPGGMSESSWTIEVFDEISGGPTGELPYVIHFVLSAPTPTDTPGSRRLRGAFPSDLPFGKAAQDRAFSTCGLSRVSLRTGSTLEVASNHTFTDFGEELPQTYFVQADRYVYIRINSLLNRRVRITISAKEGGISFAPICNIERSASELTQGGMIYGIATWDRLLMPIWRIEISSPNRANVAEKQTNRINVQILKQQAPGSFEEKEMESSYVCRRGRSGPRALQRSTLEETMSASPANLLTGVAISVPQGFTSKQISLLEQTVQMAIAIWSAECSSCPIDSLSLVEIGGHRLVRADLFRALQIWPEPISTLFAEKRTASFSVIVSGNRKYTSVSDDDPTIQKLCHADEATLPEYFRRLAIAYGCQSSSRNMMDPTLRLTVHVTDGPTACGRGVNIIGCEPDRELVELNGRDYSFGIAGGETWIGSGPRQINLLHVILHEVGHWLGMAHIDSEGSIMSPVLNTSRCIDDADMTELVHALKGPREQSLSIPKPQPLLARKPN